MSDAAVGPWIVYMASDDGAILIEMPEGHVTSADRQAAQVNRIPHVIGRGATSQEARADARRQLGRSRPQR